MNLDHDKSSLRVEPSSLRSSAFSLAYGYKRQTSAPTVYETPDHASAPRSNLTSSSGSDAEPIITPFVQILAALNNVDEFLQKVANDEYSRK